MSFVVLANSTSVILPVRIHLDAPGGRPVLKGVLVSQAKATGNCQQAIIELGAPGLERPFRGERWGYEWRPDGDGTIACWLGFPNVFFSSHVDPILRVSVEALGHPGEGSTMLRSLGRIQVTVKAGGEAAGERNPAWMPDDSPKPFPL